MAITFVSFIGYVGILCLLLGYFLLVIGQVKVIDTHYIVLNTVGALFMVFSLDSGITLPLFQTLMVWLFISLYGFYKHHINTTV